MKKVLTCATLSAALLLCACGTESDGADIIDGNHRARQAGLRSGAAADAVAFQKTFGATNVRLTDAGSVDFGTLAAFPVIEVAVDTSHVYVPDPGNNRLLVFAATAGRGDDAIFVLGQRDFFDTTGDFIWPGDPLDPTTAEKMTPTLAVVDSLGMLYVADEADTVRVYNTIVDNGQVSEFRLLSPPTSIQSLRKVALGEPPNDAEHIAVVGSSQVTFYPAGRAEPVAKYTLQDAACGSSIRDIAQIGVTTPGAHTLLLACAASTFRCPEAVQIAPPAYTPPGFNCAPVFPYRLDPYGTGSANDTEYNLPAPIDSVIYLGGVPPAYSLNGTTPVSIFATGDTVFLVDSGHRILRFTSVQQHLNGVFTQPPLTTLPNGPVGAQDSTGSVYGQLNNLPTSINANGGGSPDIDTLWNPSHIIVDASDRLWVADRGNQRVLQFASAPATTSSSSAAIVFGQSGYTVTLQNRLEKYAAQEISSIAISNVGQVYVSDRLSNRVLLFSRAAKLHVSAVPEDSVFGQSDGISYRTNGGTASTAAFGLAAPNHLAVDSSSGQLFIDDSGNFRIKIHQAASTNPQSYLGIDDLTCTTNCDSIPGDKCWITGAMAARNNLLYVAMASRLNIPIVQACSGASASNPNANRIFMYDTSSGGQSGIPDRVFGQDIELNLADTLNLNNRGGAARPDSFLNITGVAVDFSSARDGDLWVADSGNNRVLYFDDPNGTDVLAATTADAVVGQRNLASAAAWGGLPGPLSFPFVGAANPYGFLEIHGVAVDGNGGLWVSDEGAHRVLYFPDPLTPDPVAGMPRATVVLGQPGFDEMIPNNSSPGCVPPPGVPGPSQKPCEPTARTLFAPRSVAVDNTGRLLLVGDTGNNRMLRFYRNLPPAIAGGGTFQVPEGQGLSVTLVASDPDGDTPGDPQKEDVDPASADGAVTVANSTVDYVAPLGAAGRIVRVRVSSTDNAVRPETGWATVIFEVIAEPRANWVPGTPPDARTQPTPETGCLCDGGSVSALPLVLLLALWRRRRQRH